MMQLIYKIPVEALNSPNDDAGGDVEMWAESDAKRILRLVESLRAYPSEELAKHGIRLEPPKDWATELWADLQEERGLPYVAHDIREGELGDDDKIVIGFLRKRVPQIAATLREEKST